MKWHAAAKREHRSRGRGEEAMPSRGRKPVTPPEEPASGAGFEEVDVHRPFKPVARVRIPLGVPSANFGQQPQ